MSIQSVTDALGVVPHFDNITSLREPESSFITYKALAEENITMDFLNSVFSSILDKPWVGSIIGSCLVSLSGVVPLLIIRTDDGDNLNKGAGGQSLKTLLSFAVGGLLGDVFLHLLPEAWMLQSQLNDGHPSMFCGLWVLAGLLLFIIVEKMFAAPEPKEEEVKEKEVEKEEKTSGANGDCRNNNNHDEKLSKRAAEPTRPSQKEVAGYLNLMANSVDNFTHGLAVGGSFLLSPRVGALTTLAILVHEVPHEIGDFAILLRAGFSRWDAAKAQLLTGAAGLVGALTAVTCSGAEAKTSWILPFTAGGFLHISLVTVLPELLREENPRESLKQLASLVCGIVLMAVMTAVFEG